MNYSNYQLNIFDWVKNGKGNLIVEATAGSGKTSTALNAAQFMKGSVLFLAFNKKISVEIQSKLSSMALPNCNAQTFHAEGLRNYTRAKGKVKVESSKVYFIVEKYCQTEELSYARPFIQKLVGFAKNAAFGVKGQTSIDDTDAWMNIIKTQDISLDADVSLETCIEIAKEVLKENNRDFRTIDFDDMIYLPLIYVIDFVKYDWIIVDEAQDTNACRKLMLKNFMSNTSRLLIIGDSEQAIYFFCGAESNSMSLIKDMYNCDSLPLSICYRCGKSIIEEAKKYSDNIEAWEHSPDGVIKYEKYETFCEDVVNYNLTKNDGIVCRNNAPLVSLAFAMIRKGIGCRIEGRDIGKNLINLCNKWKVLDLNSFMEKLIKFFDKEFERATKAKMQMLEDKLETIILLVERCQSLGKHDVQSLKDLINGMFSDSDEYGVPNVVVLSSIHKAKGLQFKRVYCLGNDQLMPSKYAVTEEAKYAEKCLQFVSVTRAQELLTFITDIPLRNKQSEVASND